MAGVPGLEPGPKVLETSMLTVNTIPLCERGDPEAHPSKGLLVFAMHGVAAAPTTELLELQPVRCVLFVLRRDVVAFLALRAL